jgi:hypothetical protein
MWGVHAADGRQMNQPILAQRECSLDLNIQKIEKFFLRKTK